MIVCCGEALVDMVPHPVPGGGPMNAAVAAARLGAPTALLGRISTDAYGDMIWRYLLDNGIDLSACERGDEPTTRAFITTEPTLSFRFEADSTADSMLQKADLSPLGDGPHIVHSGTWAMFRGRTATTLLRLAERHRGLVSLDPNVRPHVIDDRQRWDWFHRRWLENTHVYRVSDEDAAWIWPSRRAESWAGELTSARDGPTSVQVVLVTEGASGATVYLPGDILRVPGRQVHVTDTVGAGDTFIGSVLASLWRRGVTTPAALASVTARDWTSIATRAVAASAITCTRPGADPPTLDELPATVTP